jgi:hypothetical protein
MCCLGSTALNEKESSVEIGFNKSAPQYGLQFAINNNVLNLTACLGQLHVHHPQSRLFLLPQGTGKSLSGILPSEKSLPRQD